MAQPQLIPFKQRSLQLVLQASSGAFEPTDPSTDGISLYDGSAGIAGTELTDNPDRPYFTGDDFAWTRQHAFIEGEFRLIPPAKPGDNSQGTPSCHRLLLPGGMKQVLDGLNNKTRYEPITTGIASSSAVWWQAGLRMPVYDARHQISSVSLEIGQRAKGKVRIQGSFDGWVETPKPAVTLPDEVGPPIEHNNGRTTITVDSVPLIVHGRSLSVDFGSEVKTHGYTDLKVTEIDDRKASFSLLMARTALDDFDPVALRSAGKIIHIKLRVLSTTGLYTQLEVRGKIKDVQKTETDGKYTWTLTGPCIASGTGGNEFAIEFGNLAFTLLGTLEAGEEGVPYLDALTTDGYTTGGLSWSITAGNLPPGLSLDPSSGEISGTPDVASADSYTFTVKAVNAEGFSAVSEQTIVITP